MSHLPLDEALTIPSSWYYDEPIHQRDQRIYHKTWQLVAHLDELKENGDFVTFTVCNEPVLVMNNNGKIKAMSNVCRHRGTTLLNDLKGRVNKIRCPYHGWTYNLEGKLLGTPEFEGVKNFCKEKNSLPEFSIKIISPLVFACLESPIAPAPDFPDFCHLKRIERRTYDLLCNWKVFVDNYLDGGYHVNYVHQKLAESIDYSQYKTVIGDHYVLQTSPLNNSNNLRTGIAQYYWFFPNLMLNFYDGYADINTVFPISPTECRVYFDFYFDTRKYDEQTITDSIQLAHQVQTEDRMICEKVQQGMLSRLYNVGRFSTSRENGDYYFQTLLKDKTALRCLYVD
jgi:choline monooxygenase